MAQRTLLRPVVWGITDVQVHGRENLDNFNGPYVVVSNHSSHLDTPLIIGALPRRLSRYLATGAAADYFFRNWWKAAPTALFFNAFPVERTGTRNRSGLAGKLLSDGVPLLLFPEGTRSRTGQMASFKPGAAALCISRNVPCIPIAIVGAHEAMPRDTGWVRRGRPAVHVVIGTPMWSRPGESARRFSMRISKVIGDMHDQTALTVGLPRLIEYASMATEKQAGDSLRARGDHEVIEEQAQDAIDPAPVEGIPAADDRADEPAADQPPETPLAAAADHAAPDQDATDQDATDEDATDRRATRARVIRQLAAPVRAAGRIASSIRRVRLVRVADPPAGPAASSPAEPDRPDPAVETDQPAPQIEGRPRVAEEETS